MDTIKKRIDELKMEINELENKKIELLELEKKYYCDYYSIERDDYALLKEIPDNPFKIEDKSQVLYRYSLLNIDTIGNLICKLFHIYEKRNYLCMRNYVNEEYERRFFDKAVSQPILAIGESDVINKYRNKYVDNEFIDDDKNIIIEYSKYYPASEYQTDNPVTYREGDIFSSDEIIISNYNFLLGFYNGLKFDYKGFEFIKELIYSLAYYQKKHDIEQLTDKETVEVFKKIYKK